jgi:hypothetical protein
MTTTPEVLSTIASAAQQPSMRPRNDLSEPGWMFWELRTLNIHRVVGFAGEYRQFADARDLEAEIIVTKPLARISIFPNIIPNREMRKSKRAPMKRRNPLETVDEEERPWISTIDCWQVLRSQACCWLSLHLLIPAAQARAQRLPAAR